MSNEQLNLKGLTEGIVTEPAAAELRHKIRSYLIDKGRTSYPLSMSQHRMIERTVQRQSLSDVCELFTEQPDVYHHHLRIKLHQVYREHGVRTVNIKS